MFLGIGNVEAQPDIDRSADAPGSEAAVLIGAVSGVRCSWDMFARNSLLCWLATSRNPRES